MKVEPWVDGANLLREARRALHLSQTQLCREVGISQSYLSHLERGDYWPALPLAIRLATTLKRTIEDLWKPAGSWPGLRSPSRPRGSPDLAGPGSFHVSPLDQLRAHTREEGEGR